MHNTITPTLPNMDEKVATRLGDEILLDAAKHEKVKKVKGSPGVRAWSRGGNVD